MFKINSRTNLKKIIQTSFVIITCSTALLGCTLHHPPNTCEQLKRQWMYYTTNPNVEASWITSSQKDVLRQKMVAMNCI